MFILSWGLRFSISAKSSEKSLAIQEDCARGMTGALVPLASCDGVAEDLVLKKKFCRVDQKGG